METWGSWTFSKENNHLLVETLNKFTTDNQCNLIDTPTKIILSSLANSLKVQYTIITI